MVVETKMRSRFPFPAFAAVLVLVVALPAQSLEAPGSGNAVFDRAVRLVMENFHDSAALPGFVDAVRHEIDAPHSSLTATSPPARVDAAIDSVLASLNASHTGRFKQDSIAYFELADVFRGAIRRDLRRLFPPQGEVSYLGIGMIATRKDGKWYVTDIYDGSPAARAGILLGDEILDIDGEPYREIASFSGKFARKVAVRLRRHAGAEPIAIQVLVQRIEPLPAFEDAIAKSAAVVERDGRRIGYIRLWTLSAPRSMDVVAEALAEGRLKDVDGLVLDLRGRWGGGESDAAELFLGRTPDFKLVGRNREDMIANVRWKKPLVAIIDEGSRSGLELFAYSLKINGIRLVGSRTAGALLAGRAFLLPDDSLLEIAVADAVIGGNVRLEGVGVEPDVPVAPNLPYAAGWDAQRVAAVEEMRRILAGE
jgi:carboxyl-terminal processing protease